MISWRRRLLGRLCIFRRLIRRGIVERVDDAFRGRAFSRKASSDCRRRAADQLAPAFRRASFDRHGYAVDRKRIVGGGDLVNAVGFAARVDQRTGDFVTQSGDRSAPDVVVGRTADHCAAVVGHVADCDDF